MESHTPQGWRERLRGEFAIHFKASPDELQFLEQFIADEIKLAEEKAISRYVASSLMGRAISSFNPDNFTDLVDLLKRENLI